MVISYILAENSRSIAAYETALPEAKDQLINTHHHSIERARHSLLDLNVLRK
jgi:hypothetical protein